MNATTSSPQMESLKALVEQPKAVGSDLSALVDKLKEWLANLQLDGLGKHALHALFHYVSDVAVKRIKEQLPDWADKMFEDFIIPALQKIHDAMFGPDVAPT